MTDDLSLDLERVAASVPAMPNDYAYLKSLIQSLPSPLAPEMRTAATGSVVPVTPGMTSAAQVNSSMTSGAAIGELSGASVGVVSELFYANSNLLANPLLEVPSLGSVNFTTTNTPFMWNWQGKYVLNSGATPGLIAAGLIHLRGSPQNPFNSSIMDVELYAAAASDFSAYIYPISSWSPLGADSSLQWLVASCRVSWRGLTVDPDTTMLRARMEIVDDTGVTTGPWLDMLPHSGTSTVFRLSAARPRPTTRWDDASVSPYLWRLRIDRAGTGDAYDRFVWGEPALALASTQAPPPFSPVVGGWSPNTLSVRKFNAGDPAGIFPCATYDESIRFGSGSAATDTNLYRAAADTLKTDDSLTIMGGLSFNDARNEILQHGQWTGWLKMVPGTGITEGWLEIWKDPTDANRAILLGSGGGVGNTGLLMGPGGSTPIDTRIARSGTKSLRVDDAAGGGAILYVVPSTAQTLAAGTAILANANIVQINSAGNVTITAAPTIANGVDGQVVTIINVDTADTITLQDQGTLASSNLRLAATTVALAPRQSITLMYSSAIGDWVQISNKVAVL